MTTIHTLWRRAGAQLSRHRSERDARNRARDSCVARQELCPQCYQGRGERGLRGTSWKSCTHPFHDTTHPVQSV
jgi:hypothetical protein